MDFTKKIYNELLQTLIDQNYTFQTFKEFLISPNKRSIILRHDVDLLPKNSLRFAKTQSELGIKGSYYFRVVPESWDENIILEIANLGHEVGYHYETMDTAKGNVDLAMEQFKQNLSKLRKLVDVKTICMHGSPMSKYDNKDLWKEYNYKELGIIGEPYFDIDFDRVFYLTDTGRRWNGGNVSVRDKVVTLFQNTYQSTDDIIRALKNEELPNQVMFTFHPQRWHNNKFLWIKELLMQNSKNVVKKYFLVR